VNGPSAIAADIARVMRRPVVGAAAEAPPTGARFSEAALRKPCR
jgi:hypothetical protein